MSPISSQRLETGDDIKHLLVDRALTQAMQSRVQLYQQFADQDAKVLCSN